MVSALFSDEINLEWVENARNQSRIRVCEILKRRGYQGAISHDEFGFDRRDHALKRTDFFLSVYIYSNKY